MMNLTKELDIDENTLIVMSADNGGSLTWRELGGVNGDLRCGKGTTYEGGHRVPLIARWPVWKRSARHFSTTTNRTFAKTGSGQISEKLRQERAINICRGRLLPVS
eukprot:COSAG06_NODE_1262_length_10069_cov_2.923972_8_plen_106_part_00